MIMTATMERQTLLPRLGFLGVGWIGRSRLEALARSGEAEIAALYDPDPRACAAAREIAPHVECVTTLSRLFELSLDGLVIGAPSPMQADFALAALARDMPVFCEKPLGRDLADVERIVAAAKRHDRLLGVDLSFRRTRALEELADVVRGGSLGRVFAVDLAFHTAHGPDMLNHPQHDGQGALSSLGVHMLDAMLWVLDFPRVTSITCQLHAHGQPVTRASGQPEDHAAVQLRL